MVDASVPDMSGGPSVRVIRPMVMVLLVAFAFWRPLFAGDPLLPDDQLWLGDPWNVDAPAGVGVDVADREPVAVHSAWVAWSDDVRSGELSWWQEVGAGAPFLADGLPFTHLVYLVVPEWYAPGLVAALAVLVAAGGAMVLTDRRADGPWAGLFAGVVYGLSGVMWVWIGWPQATAIALVPWVVFAVGEAGRLADARSVTRLAVVVALQLWCGVFSLSVFSVGAALGWSMLERGRGAWRRGLLPVLWGLAGGVGLAAMHLWPRWRRWDWSDTSAIEEVGDTTAPVRALVTTVFGNGLGNDSVGVGWMEAGSLRSSVVFVGFVAVLLAVLGQVGGGRAFPPRVVGVAALVVVVVGGPVERFIGMFVGAAAEMTDARPVFVLALAVSAGYGIERLASGGLAEVALREVSGTVRMFLALLALAGVALGAAWIDVLLDTHSLPAVAGLAFGPTLVLTLVAGVAAAVRAGHLTGRGAAVAVAALGVYELLSFGMPIPTVTDGSQRPVATAAHAALDEVLGDFDRIAGDDLAFAAATAARFGHGDVRAPGLRSAGEIGLLRAVDPGIVTLARGGGPFAPVVHDRLLETDLSGHPSWDLLGVDVWVLPFDAAPPGPRRYPVVDERLVAAVTPPFGTVPIPEHGLRAVILDLVTPPFTTVSLRVDAGGEQAETEVLLRSARDGMTAIPIAGEHLVAGDIAGVHATFEANGEIVYVGTAEGDLAVGSVGGTLDGSLVWTRGALVVTRTTPRAVWEGEGNAVVTVVGEAPGRLSLEIDAPVGGMVRTDVVDEPGWSVAVDGDRVEHTRVGDTVIAVAVPPGATTVEVRYRPPHLAVTFVVSVLTVLALGAGPFLGRTRR